MDHGETIDRFPSTFETLIDGCHDGVLTNDFPSFLEASIDGCYDGYLPTEGCQRETSLNGCPFLYVGERDIPLDDPITSHVSMCMKTL